MFKTLLKSLHVSQETGTLILISIVSKHKNLVDNDLKLVATDVSEAKSFTENHMLSID